MVCCLRERLCALFGEHLNPWRRLVSCRVCFPVGMEVVCQWQCQLAKCFVRRELALMWDRTEVVRVQQYVVVPARAVGDNLGVDIWRGKRDLFSSRPSLPYSGCRPSLTPGRFSLAAGWLAVQATPPSALELKCFCHALCLLCKDVAALFEAIKLGRHGRSLSITVHVVGTKKHRTF